MQLYGFTGVGLFAIVCWITSIFIGYLADHIEETASDSSNPMALLKKWKQLHVALLDIVGQIQCCFGPFLLIFIVLTIVSVIVNSFFLVNGIRMIGTDLNELWGFTFLVIRCFVNLFVLSICPVILQQQVWYIVLILFQFKSVINLIKLSYQSSFNE